MPRDATRRGEDATRCDSRYSAHLDHRLPRCLDAHGPGQGQGGHGASQQAARWHQVRDPLGCALFFLGCEAEAGDSVGQEKEVERGRISWHCFLFWEDDDSTLA